MRAYASVSTSFVLVALWGVSSFLAPTDTNAFLMATGRTSIKRRTHSPTTAVTMSTNQFGALPLTSLRASLGAKGFFGFSIGFGVLMAATRSFSARRTAMQAENKPAVLEKYDLSKTYLANLPRSIMDETAVQKLLSTVPKEKWNDPPQDSFLFRLKQYAQTYGEGKATRMGWWDYFYMRVNSPSADEVYSGADMQAYDDRELDQARKGLLPLFVPGPASLLGTGVMMKWRGPEYFAADQVQSPVNAGLFAKQFIKAWAFYRDGLKPWQRGLEIGVAHGYWLIGPFTSLGQLRNTPEAATVGMLSGIVVIGATTIGGLLYGKVAKPTLFDKEGDEPGKGYNEMIQAHGAGGIGGAAFAHALISVFGS